MANPFFEAIVKHLSRVETPSPRTAEQWAQVPRDIRERAFFSAQVTNTRHLQKLKDQVADILAPRTDIDPGGKRVTRGLDLATARLEIKQMLESIGYDPGVKRGTIEDLSSDQRINLQITQNTESAQGFGNFLQSTETGAIDAYPAQELFRAEDRMEPRDWPERWQEAGGQLFGDRMIALKEDPIWESISRFDAPYPPFDYNSGMWVRDVARSEAEDLGLLLPGQPANPPSASFAPKDAPEPALE